MTASIITRVKNARIGTAGTANNYFVWTGIRSVKFDDTDPWVHISTLHGKMLHQEVRSPHIEGEILCHDLTAMSTALYNTTIDSLNHKAIDKTNVTTIGSVKWKVDYFVVNFANQSNTEIVATFSDFRIHKIIVDNIEAGKEATFIIKFSADEVSYN